MRKKLLFSEANEINVNSISSDGFDRNAQLIRVAPVTENNDHNNYSGDGPGSERQRQQRLSSAPKKDLEWVKKAPNHDLKRGEESAERRRDNESLNSKRLFFVGRMSGE